jgi:AcrR family transcriptional regulator
MAVDHEQRRRDIAEIAIDLIAREGLEAATVRRIAAEAGSSTAAITHYFGDKRELLLWTFQVLSAEGDHRFEEARRADPSGAIEALLTMLPWCPANVRRWKAYLAFWDQAARDPELAAHLARSTETGLRYIDQLLRANARPDADIEKASHLLNAVIQGLALQVLVNERYWTPERIRQNLEEAFEFASRLTPGAPPRPSPGR